jgi:hypothetical protein
MQDDPYDIQGSGYGSFRGPFSPVKALINGLEDLTTNADLTTNVDPKTVKEEWLNSQYLSGANIDFRVRDFATITAATHKYDSYWRDAHIDWALELLRNSHGQYGDIRIVDTALAARLYSVSQRDSIPARTSQEYRDTWSADEALLKERPILFIPINDGYQQQYGDGAADIPQPDPAAGDNPSANSTNAKKSSERPRSGGHGNHWSFLVLDMRDVEEYSARYIDGMVQVTRNRSGRLKIHNTNFNAPIAGRIVCAMEKLLQIPEGTFKASTIRFIPHMKWDDQYQGVDHGRCGPHLYAFMNHLLANKTDLIDPGLEATFNDEAIMTTRHNAFQFHSADVRAKFADDLLQVRRTQEAGSGSMDIDNLSRERLRTIITSDVLTALIESCMRSPARGGAFKRRGKRRDDRDDSSDDGGGGDGDDGNGTRDMPWDSEQTRKLRKRWREQFANGDPYKCGSFGGFIQMLAAQSSFDDKSGGNGKPEAGSGGQTRPDFSEVLSKEPIDFLSMDKEQIRQWVEKTPINTSLNHGLELWHQKAILQKIFGGIDELTKDETIVWRQEWLQSNSPSHRDVLKEMRHRLRDIPTGNFRGKLRYYPDYYLKEGKIVGVSNDNGNGNAGSSSVPTSGTGEGSSDPLPLRPHPDAAAPKAGSKRKPSPRRTPSQPPAKKRRPASRSGRGTPSPL